MKGIVYSGIVYMPEHPDSDLHGLIRIAVRTRGGWIEVRKKLTIVGLNSSLPPMIWQISKSHAEEQATDRNYGILLACPLALQYLKAENYKPIPKSLLRRKA